VRVQWDEAAFVEVDTPWRQREEKFAQYLQWFRDRLSGLTNAPNQWYKDDGLGHGVYWWYAWAWKHKEALGLKQDSIREIVREEEPRDVNPVVLDGWWTFFNSDTDNPQIAELKRRWDQLPGPKDLHPDKAREAMAELESWFANYTEYQNEEPDIELKTRRIYTAEVNKKWQDQGKFVYRHRFADYKGEEPVRHLYLITSTAVTPHEDDVIVWRNGKFLYGDDLEKKEPGPTKPWHKVEGVTLQTRDGKPVAWGSHPDGVAIGPDAVGVRAPSVLKLTVPEDAKGLELEIFIDQQKYPEALVQTWVSPKIPKAPDDDISQWITARRPIGIGNNEREFRRQSDAWRDLFFEWGKFNVRPNTDYIWTGVEELIPYYSQIDGEYNENPPNEPYRLTHTELFDAVDAEERAEYDALVEEMRILAQMPHQDLLELMKKNELELAEGQLPTDEQLDNLPAEDRQLAEELAHALVQADKLMALKAAQQVGEFTTRAWRRPPSEEELKDLMTLYQAARDKGKSYDFSTKQALRGSLVSIHFLYRYQKSLNSPDPYAITARGLADRLAFVLWGSIPDEQLLARVADGTLTEPDVLLQETRRMLRDERAKRMAQLFAGEWIGYKDFSSHNDPDPDRYEQYHEEEIAPLMEREATLFFNDILRGKAPATALYQGDYTYLNETLAEFYGINGVDGEEFRRVELPENRQGGVLTLGAMLTKKSMPLRTSAVNRGAWILETILGEHLPDPPPNVPELSDDEKNEEGLTVAQQLARHRDDPACMGCHQRMDPLGIALENFDPVGQWRSEFLDGTPVESTDVAADGTELQGLQGLTQFLDERRDKVLYNFCHMFAGYALGRPIQPSDRPLIEDMRDAVVAADNQFPAAIQELVTSKQFRFRRDEV
jgi:hypothetical protein